MIRLLRRWFAANCLACGDRKPLFTGYCDECAVERGLPRIKSRGQAGRSLG